MSPFPDARLRAVPVWLAIVEQGYLYGGEGISHVRDSMEALCNYL